jgi:glycogen(starch) synthase
VPLLNGRLLMTTDAVGGVWSYALDLARGLVRTDVETTLAIFGPPPDPIQQAAAAAIPGLTLVQTGFPLDWDERVEAAQIERAAAGLADLAADSGADVIQLNSPIFAAGARFPVPVVGFCHSCLSTWWYAVRGGVPLPASFAWRGDLLREAYWRCDILVAPSAAFATATAAILRLQRPPTIVHNGRDSPVADHAAEPTAAIFTAGRLWDEGKNARTLDDAAGRLDTPIHAAGSLAAPDGQAVRFAHLRTLGRLSDARVNEWLATQPIFVSLSRYEPFGLAVLEAARAGCALVLSDIPTFRELWSGVARFVPADNAAAAAAALQALLQQPSVRQRLGEAAARRGAHLTINRMTRRMMTVYGTVSRSSRFNQQAAP